MSFKPTISDTSICNDALARLPAEPITSINDPSLEGRECRRAYKDVVAQMLERHHWGLAAKRAQLASITNDRKGEWAFAYAKPSDLAFPVRVIPATGNPIPIWFTETSQYYTRAGQGVFKMVGDTIYSNVEFASLEYTSYDINEGQFTAMFKLAVELELATRICLPITKSQSRYRELMQESEGFFQRVKANDMNRDQPTYGNNPTESEITRFNGSSRDFIGSGYALDPVAFPSNTG